MTHFRARQFSIMPEVGLAETCLEKYRYLAFRRINSLSSFKKRNAIVASKDTVSFNFGIVVRRPLSSPLKKVSSEENVLSVFVLFFHGRFSFELNAGPSLVYVILKGCIIIF